MKLANVDGRAALVLGDEIADIATASEGRFGADPMAALRPVGRVPRLRGHRHRRRPAPSSKPQLRNPVPRPRQVFAIGLNYRSHAEESGMAVPEVPIVFTKFPASLAGPFDDIEVGRRCRSTGRSSSSPSSAAPPTASTRPTPGRTSPASPSGRTSATGTCSSPPAASSPSASPAVATGPSGPGSSRPTSSDNPDDLALGCSVNGEKMQDARTSDLVFDVPQLIAELSAILPLLPGDVIFTGTPGGVGVARKPPRFLQPGDTLETWIEGIGTIRNRIVEGR